MTRLQCSIITPTGITTAPCVTVIRRVAKGGLAPPPHPNRSAPEICTVIKQLRLTGTIVYLVLYLTVLTFYV